MEEVIHGTPLGPRVIEARPEKNHHIFLLFDNGERRIFDATPILDKTAFKRLKDDEFFNLVTVDHGSIAWPGDIDYCPDTLYSQSVELSRWSYN